jgi:two-component system sensor histidine kinase HydH
MYSRLDPPQPPPSVPPVADAAMRRLTGLTAARLLLYALLLAAVAFFYLRGDRAAYPESIRFLSIILGAAFAAAGVYAAWLRTRKALVALAWTQVVVDQLIWTGLVYITGGPLSGATTFFGLSCVLAAVTLGFDGAVATALLGGVLYSLLVLGFSLGVIRPPVDQAPFTGRPSEFIYSALVTLLGLTVVALLSGYLARRLQTESGRLVEVTERAEKAERLAALGRVAAALAHEIRNPLGSISGSIDIIREAPGLGEDEKRLCEIIRSETNRLNDLVGDMMNLARPRLPSVEPIDVARVASDVVQLARRSGRGEGDVPIEYEGPASAPSMGDAAQIRQLVWNLVRNAVQASVAGTPVRVRVGMENGRVNIDVIDRGAGIPEAMRERIFDAFITTRSQGVGIGLAVVKQIVDAHHADIVVLDSEGGGSTFRVTLAAPAETARVNA